MRRRLTVAMVGVVAGALLLAGVGTLLISNRVSRNDARRDVSTELRALKGTGAHRRPVVFRALYHQARLDGAIFRPLSPAGTIVGHLPAGLSPSDFATSPLLSGRVSSGTKGDLAYAATRVTLTPIEQAALGFSQERVVAVLARRVTGVGTGIDYVLAVAGVTLLVAGAVAERLSRRITRPLEDAAAATRRIAAGDLDTQVPMVRGGYPELTSLAGSINTMAASLGRAKGLERQFLLSVSHDLRTPLTSIRGFAEAIADGTAPDPRRAAVVITSEARRLERLVRDLLELAKLDARRFSLDLRRVDVGEVVADTAEGFRPAGEQAGLEISVEVSEAPDLWASADPDRLAQVLANLVENALNFASRRLRIVAERAGDEVVVVVEDDGPGIASEDLGQVFDRLHQSSRTPTRQVGSGLGLAIVSELVDAMGATVRAESPISPSGGGTRMVVALSPWPSSGSPAA